MERLAFVARQLREGRRRAEMSVAEAAAASGLSTGFISLLENAKTDVTVGRLSRLLAIYDMRLIDVAELNEAEIDGTPAGPAVCRASSYQFDSEGVTYQVFPESGGLSPVHVRLAPNGSWSESSMHSGGETIYTLHGRIELRAGADTVILTAGQSFYVEPWAEHRLRNLGSELAELFVLVEEPGPATPA